MVLLILFYAIMAGVYTFGKQVLLYAAPLFLTGIRILPAGLCFLGYQYFFNKEHFYIKKEHAPYIFGYSIIIFLMDALRLKALSLIISSNTAFVATLSPFIAAFFSWYFFKERFSNFKIVALFMGVVGVFPLLITNFKTPTADISALIVGYGSILISTVCFVLAGVLSKTLISKKQCPFFMVVGLGMLGAGTFATVLSLLTETWNPLPIFELWPAVKLISYLFITHSLIAYPLYNYLMQIYPITLVAFAQLTVPFFTAFLSFVFLGETVEPVFFVSLFILTTSLWLFYKQELKEGLIK
jgi:drug/metabolite transporter (DMT)-like permease